MGNQSPKWSIWVELSGTALACGSIYHMAIDQWVLAGLLLASSLGCLLVAVRGNTL